jgi:class 3 adenylate cyclase
VTPSGDAAAGLFLLADQGAAGEARFAFYHQLEIGRDEPGRDAAPGTLLVSDPTVSFRHCVLSRLADGRCTLRDLSRNGTRIDGRRLVPNVETELHPGQVIELGAGCRFRVAGEPPAAGGGPAEGRTISATGTVIATILVGDIRDYTVLVRTQPKADVQDSVNRVFASLTSAVTEHEGTMKEYQGDAIFAFWEGDLRGRQAGAACRAALALDRLARELAGDPAVWTPRDFALRMDWALATGSVRIDALGGARPTGLSMVGDPVTFAFRLEKFANDETGRILACHATREMAKRDYVFRDLGEIQAKGFDKPDRVYALEGLRVREEAGA